jgi:hypothetical protein
MYSSGIGFSRILDSVSLHRGYGLGSLIGALNRRNTYILTFYRDLK